MRRRNILRPSRPSRGNGSSASLRMPLILRISPLSSILAARGMTLANSWLRYVRTLSYLTTQQVVWRVWRRVRRAWVRNRAVTLPAPLPAFSSKTVQALEHYVTRWKYHTAPSTKSLAHGHLTLLSQAVDLKNDIPWQDAAYPMLWRYQLHTCEWMRHAPQEQWQRWMQDWIAKNPPHQGVGWDPYPLSLRLVYWSLCCAAARFDTPALRESLWRQIDALRADIEYDVRANHLWWNAVALVVAGQLLGHPACAQGLTLLENEVREQILPDGGHYERSPMYHAHMLEAGLIAYAALEERPEWLRAALLKMAGFLEGILHPDGDIPLFGDSVLGESVPPKALVALAREYCGAPVEKSTTYPHSGFYIFPALEGAAHVIAKAGVPGPSYQLGHTHGDVFSYEMSLHGQRFIVDAGTHGYAESPLRDYVRSARAHNTVSVEGREPLECWSAFRVGRRYAVRNVQFRASEGGITLSGEHDGYRPVIHRRVFQTDKDVLWVVDTVESPHACTAESYIHFHPEVSLEPDGDTWRARRGDSTLSVQTFGFDSAEIQRGQQSPAQGWYSPEFAVALPAPVLVLRTPRANRLSFHYALSCTRVGPETGGTLKW